MEQPHVCNLDVQRLMQRPSALRWSLYFPLWKNLPSAPSPVLSPIIFLMFFLSFPFSDHTPPDPPNAGMVQPAFSSWFCS